MERELEQLKTSQGLLGQTSQQMGEQVNPPTEVSLRGEVAKNSPFQVRLLKKCKFLIEKDHSEKEMAVQVNWFSS